MHIASTIERVDVVLDTSRTLGTSLKSQEKEVAGRREGGAIPIQACSISALTTTALSLWKI
jgi:hypothetical protein